MSQRDRNNKRVNLYVDNNVHMSINEKNRSIRRLPKYCGKTGETFIDTFYAYKRITKKMCNSQK